MLTVEIYLAALQWKPRDPICSCFVTIHLRHGRQTDNILWQEQNFAMQLQRSFTNCTYCQRRCKRRLVMRYWSTDDSSEVYSNRCDRHSVDVISIRRVLHFLTSPCLYTSCTRCLLSSTAGHWSTPVALTSTKQCVLHQMVQLCVGSTTLKPPTKYSLLESVQPSARWTTIVNTSTT